MLIESSGVKVMSRIPVSSTSSRGSASAEREIPVIIDALLRGYKDDVDILTLSLGEADGFSESAVAVAASRIAKTGKVITIAGA